MSKIIDTINSLDIQNLEYKCFEFLNNKCFYRQYNLLDQNNYFSSIKGSLNLLEALYFPSFRFFIDDLSLLDVTFITRKGLDKISINSADEIFYLRGEIYASTEGCNCGKKDDASVSDFINQVMSSKFDKDLQLCELQYFSEDSRDKKIWKKYKTGEVVSEIYQITGAGIPKEIASFYNQDIIDDISQEKIIIMGYGWENKRPFITLMLHPEQVSS